LEFEKSGTHWSRRFIKWLNQVSLEHESGTKTLKILVQEKPNSKESSCWMFYEKSGLCPVVKSTQPIWNYYGVLWEFDLSEIQANVLSKIHILGRILNL
jgi:hypothetical protein